jgi:predicted SAM-dependent methyltransferase
MKLHLGCGSRYIPGFTHIDARNLPHIDIVGPVDSLPSIKTNSVDLIYTCHVLEHFKRNDVKHTLLEWFRVLKPGGELRIAVPDFSVLCDLYYKDRDLKKIIGPLYGRQDHEFNFHYNTFDFNSLKDILISAGFRSVRRYNWRDTEHAQVDDFSQAYIPHLDKTNGTLISLNVSCNK